MIIMTKTGAAVSIVIWSVAALVLTFLLILGVVSGFGINMMLKGELREVFSVQEDNIEFDGFDISWHSGRVDVSPSDDNTLIIKQTSHYNVKPLIYEVSGKKVIIRQEPSWGLFFIFGNFRSSNLEILLPQKQYEEFILKMTSGKTDINGIDAESIKLNLTSGQLGAEDISAKSLSVSMTSGNAQVNGAIADNFKAKLTSGRAVFGGEFGAVECYATSGEMEILSEGTPESLDAKMTSGDISVTIPDNDGFTVDVNKTSGSFDSSFDLTSNMKDSDGFYSYGKGKDAGRDYTVRITSGKFRLYKLQ